MQFSDLTKAVHDAWSFAWPPLVLCCIAYAIAHYFHPDGTDDALLQVVAHVREFGLKLEGVRALLEPYGLTKLVPVIFVVVFVGFMYLLNSPISIAVSNLPPHLAYRPDRLIAEGMSENERLVLLRKYPTSRSLNEAYSLALASAKAESKDFPHTSRAELWHKTQNFLKFALAAAIIMLVASLKVGLPIGGQIAKFLLVLAVLAGMWTVSLAGLLYQQEQQFHDEWRPIKLALQKDAASLLATPITNEERTRLSIESGQRWWRVYVLDQYRWRWMRRTFFP